MSRPRSSWSSGTAAVALLTFSLLAAGGCADPTGAAAKGEILVLADLTDLRVAGLAVRVTAEDIPDPLVFNIPIVDGIGTGVISVPAGTDRTIAVEAFNAGGVATHHGSAIVDVVAGANPPVSIALVPFEGDLPIEVTGDPLTITVTPPVGAISGGETLQLDAVVTDGAGNPVALTVHWGSTNPIVASVDANGLVTGVALGSANIIASAGGVSGVATVAVTEGAVRPMLFTMAFFGPARALDLDAGTVVDCGLVLICLSGTPPGWDLRISFNALTTAHAFIITSGGEGVRVVELVGAVFATVTAADALSASFTTETTAPLDAARVLLIRTDLGAVYKVGNPVETATDVTFQVALLLPPL